VASRKCLQIRSGVAFSYRDSLSASSRQRFPATTVRVVSRSTFSGTPEVRASRWKPLMYAPGSFPVIIRSA
jgi:hypothetical protein